MQQRIAHQRSIRQVTPANAPSQSLVPAQQTTQPPRNAETRSNYSVPSSPKSQRPAVGKKRLVPASLSRGGGLPPSKSLGGSRKQAPVPQSSASGQQMQRKR